MSKRKQRELQATIGAVVLGLAVLAGAGWAIWRMMGHVSADWARLWAIVATILLPLVYATGYNLGLTESKGKLKGIDQGIERVTKAAATTIDLRASAARAMRQAARPDPSPVVLLPNPEAIITMRPQIESGEVNL